MSRLESGDILGWSDGENDYCHECAPAKAVYPIKKDDTDSSEVITCDECNKAL